MSKIRTKKEIKNEDNEIQRYPAVYTRFELQGKHGYQKNSSVDQRNEGYGLQLNPSFQRGHVWTEQQQIAWLEFFLRGGKSGIDIYFNDPFFNDWDRKEEDKDAYKDFVCVDGLQRLTAVQRFIGNEIPVYGSYYKEYTDPRSLTSYSLIFHVNNLKSEKEVLQWYIDMNAGGTPHDQGEINRVKQMIANLEKEVL